MNRSREFACDTRSIAAARRFATDTLRDHPPTDIEAVELMVSELATNSVKHAQTGFEVSISRRASEIRVEVLDTGIGRPVLGTPGETEPSGRGLLIVKALSSDWGTVDLPRGKAVWFTLPSEPRQPAGASRLEHCEQPRSPSAVRNRSPSDGAQPQHRTKHTPEGACRTRLRMTGSRPHRVPRGT